MAKIKVLNSAISIFKTKEEDYISLTDIANSKDGEQRAADIIKNWIRNRGTLEFIGTWESMYNPDFKWSNLTTLKWKRACHHLF